MKYLKVFTDFVMKTKSLTDTEFGRLLRAMFYYAETGEEQELRGNERYAWDMAKVDLDKQQENYKNICSVNKRIATERYGALRSVTERNEALRSVTERNEAWQEKEKEKDKEEKKETAPEGAVKKESVFFKKPTVAEIEAYCRERRNGIDAEAFFAHYEARGWRYNGNTPMKNWKAAVVTWEKRDKPAKEEKRDEWNWGKEL